MKFKVFLAYKQWNVHAYQMYEKITGKIQCFEDFQLCLQPLSRMVQFVFMWFRQIKFLLSRPI